jgi:hypothetical protein
MEWWLHLRRGAMKDWLVLAAVLEAATGAALLIVPSLVGQLLFGAELTGMVTYGAAVTLYLSYVGIAGASTGVLL